MIKLNNIYNMLDSYNITTYQSYYINGNYKKKLIDNYNLNNRKNIVFTLYKLTNNLSNNQIEDITSKYNNIIIAKVKCQYAMEIEKQCIIMCNHKLVNN